MIRASWAFTGLIATLSLGGMLATAHAQDPASRSLTPGHERLAKDVGTWDATIKLWMQEPDAEPSESKGVEVVKLLPGGLWAVSEFHGKVGDLAFHGSGVTGYDTKKAKYVGSWVDTTSPSLMIMEGDYDAKTDSIVLNSKGTDAASGKDYEAKMTTTWKDKDTRLFTMVMKSDDTGGQFVKLMEIAYKRHKD